MSSLDFNFLSDFENGADTLEAATEPADEGASTLEPPSAFMERCPKKSGRYIIETMKIGRDVEWIEWPSWKRFGQ